MNKQEQKSLWDLIMHYPLPASSSGGRKLSAEGLATRQEDGKWVPTREGVEAYYRLFEKSDPYEVPQ